MSRYKLTALENIELTANLWVQGTIPLPKTRQNLSQGTMPHLNSEEKTFKMKKGAYRDDVVFVSKVISRTKHLGPGAISHPNAKKVEFECNGLLKLELLDD